MLGERSGNGICHGDGMRMGTKLIDYVGMGGHGDDGHGTIGDEDKVSSPCSPIQLVASLDSLPAASARSSEGAHWQYRNPTKSTN